MLLNFVKHFIFMLCNKISRSPRIRILDTPGIAVPHIEDPMVGIKLALTGLWKVLPRKLAQMFMYIFSACRGGS